MIWPDDMAGVEGEKVARVDLLWRCLRQRYGWDSKTLNTVGDGTGHQAPVNCRPGLFSNNWWPVGTDFSTRKPSTPDGMILRKNYSSSAIKNKKKERKILQRKICISITVAIKKVRNVRGPQVPLVSQTQLGVVVGWAQFSERQWRGVKPNCMKMGENEFFEMGGTGLGPVCDTRINPDTAGV